MHTSAYCMRFFYRHPSLFPLLYSYSPVSPLSFYLSYVSSPSIWIFITSGGRIRDEIYDVLLTNPSREVAWRRIVYLQMHSRSIGPTKQKEREKHTYIHRHKKRNDEIYISRRRDEFGSSRLFHYVAKI